MHWSNRRWKWQRISNKHFRSSLISFTFSFLDGWDLNIDEQKYDMSSVRLCFQLLTRNPQYKGSTREKYKWISLDCAVSTPIMDKRVHGELKILEMEPKQSPVRTIKCSMIGFRSVTSLPCRIIWKTLLLYHNDPRITRARIYTSSAIHCREARVMRLCKCIDTLRVSTRTHAQLHTTYNGLTIVSSTARAHKF